MKVLIVGYGSMGKEVEKVLLSRGHEIAGRIDPAQTGGVFPELTDELMGRADAAIEFALPQAVIPHAKMYARNHIPAVVGTTGWDAARSEVKTIIEGSGGTYLWGSNFSIGAHIFFALAEQAARLINPVPEYDILAYEIHHNRKKDSPSGTALTLGERILRANDRKKTIVTERLDRAIEPSELHIASVRGGSIPGTHTVLIDSASDTIEITHRARNRGGFALGAVFAAEWLIGKKGFFSVEEFIEDFMHTMTVKGGTQ
ncbi:MAG TPA: 4-hydroxy-tetrahydrodipicolinate reductase [Spirochaetia bacterium]|mgnify:CR=1 FL=1|jgi:4-hydroxy-tetrahydrodipicolinate reductase|nr:4-hydroxy-tetrahydrodipicolinate reductase [Spirochaetia bacterium]